ncbi:MAG: hypothetical protein IJC48_10770 [Clostridia bacterium]|nr:hypothetical protein [Clostridia bacterium]
MNPTGKIWLVRLIAFVFALIICLLFFRIWLTGVLGCANAFQSSTYTDEDESQRTPQSIPFETIPPIDDSAYDQSFPDLVEPGLGE